MTHTVTDVGPVSNCGKYVNRKEMLEDFCGHVCSNESENLQFCAPFTFDAGVFDMALYKHGRKFVS